MTAFMQASFSVKAHMAAAIIAEPRRLSVITMREAYQRAMTCARGILGAPGRGHAAARARDPRCMGKKETAPDHRGRSGSCRTGQSRLSGVS
ncbi:MAG: hypothetical protein KDD96_05425, partial [Rhodobacteraceae bacterium]|nr:hypothetical protein [Paracoccaceae bacterium]